MTMIRKPEQWIEIARLTFEDAVPGEVLPSHGPLSDQDRVLFRDWECAAAPRGVHKSLVSGMAIQMHEGEPALAFTGQVCHRTADRELLLKDRRLHDCQISALVLPQDAECGPTTDRADCAEALVGIVFRLATMRQYYQFGIEGMRRLVLYRRNHDEWTVLAAHPLPDVKAWIDLTVNLRGDAIHCISRAAGVDFTVTDTFFHSGLVGVRALRRALLKVPRSLRQPLPPTVSVRAIAGPRKRSTRSASDFPMRCRSPVSRSARRGVDRSSAILPCKGGMMCSCRTRTIYPRSQRKVPSCGNFPSRPLTWCCPPATSPSTAA